MTNKKEYNGVIKIGENVGKLYDSSEVKEVLENIMKNVKEELKCQTNDLK